MFEPPHDVPALLHREAHALRGTLAPLLLLAGRLGAPATSDTEELQRLAQGKVRDLAAFADRLDLLADHLRVEWGKEAERAALSSEGRNK